MAFENRNRKQELRCNKLQKELSFENSLFLHDSVYYFLFLKVIKNMYGIDNRLGRTFDTKHTAVNA